MKRKILASFLTLLCASGLVFAESELGFRLMPRFSAALGSPYFTNGFGAAASLDWRFLDFSPTMALGLSAQGSFGTMGEDDPLTDSLTLAEGGLGPFFQWRITERLSLRADLNAGVYRYQEADSGNTRARGEGGVSAYFHFSPYASLFADTSYTYYAFSDTPINAFKAGLGIYLNLGEILRPTSRVAAQRTGQERVFPVSFAWYEKNSFASVLITNNEPNSITQLDVSFFLERYMNEETVFITLPRLERGESVELPVTALFNGSMLELRDNTKANAALRLAYRSLGAKKELSIPLDMTIYHRNAMSWDDDRRAASFVSPRDSAAALFAKYTASAVRRYLAANPPAASSPPENVMLAAALFETLNLYGMNYVIDPASSYIEFAENASALDSLNYPYQTLYFRGGDCDDLSILYCSLLEALEIETAFITIPGHIYMAFDSGGWKAEGLVEQDGKRWLPVEITIPDRGFAEACRTGTREWRNAGDGARLYPTRESWKIYPPVSVPGGPLPEMPEEEDILRRFRTWAAALSAEPSLRR